MKNQSLCRKSRFKTFFFSLAVLYSGPVFSQTMNGYKVDSFGDFVNDWKLVTTRFREDSGEIRITYANAPAWDALLKNEVNYPDGAVFAKISIITERDTEFPSSKVPVGKRRIQLMVRDAKKHKETRGWGYAIFDEKGIPHQGNHKEMAMACAQCHQIVSHRGEVFSQPMFAKTEFLSKTKKSSIEFVSVDRASLPEFVRTSVASSTATLRSLTGDLKKNVFLGTLDEVRPMLIAESRTSGRTVIFLSEDRKFFSLVIPEVSRSCTGALKAFTVIHNLEAGKNKLYTNQICA